MGGGGGAGRRSTWSMWTKGNTIESGFRRENEGRRTPDEELEEKKVCWRLPLFASALEAAVDALCGAAYSIIIVKCLEMPSEGFISSV